MAITCTPDNLGSLASCWTALSQRQLKAIQIYLLCQINNGSKPTCDPSTLATAADCFTAGIPETEMDAVIVYLLCQWANA
jgi:hypothetical protein